MIVLDWFLQALSIFHCLLIDRFGFSLLLTGSSSVLHQTPLHEAPNRQSHSKLNLKPSWHKYVRAPSSGVVTPARILSSYTRGNVTNPDGLITSHGSTILTRTSSSHDRPTVVVDFGQNTAGLLIIDFAGSSNYSAGRPGIRVAFSETLQFLSDRSDFSRSYNGDTITPGTDQVAVEAKPYQWINQKGCKHGKKVCSDGLHGFRYLKIYLDALQRDSPYTTSSGSVSISSITLQLSAFLGTPDTFTGWFESSDHDLNQWWYDSVYTNDLCTDIFRANDTEPRNAASPSLEGKLVLHDGPKRDRDPYVGDLAVASRTSYLTRNISEATRNVLADLADHQRRDGWIPPASINNYTLALLDYPLYWVTSSYDYYIHTNDTSYIERYYPSLVLTLDTYYPSITNTTTQLITKGINNSRWYGDYAFLPRTGAVTYYNALYVLALTNAAFIANHLGYSDDAIRWTKRAAKVSAAVNALRFDDSVGAYYDGDCDLKPCKTHAQDGNSLAIVAGIANSTRAESVLKYLSKKHARPYGNAFYDNDLLGYEFSQRVYAFISYFELEARFLSGHADSPIEEIKRLYGWMSRQDPGVTVWEGIGKNGDPYEGGFTSMSHGWSTGIVPALTNYVLGVKPVAPGFAKWSVKPLPGGLKWARGVVPTPAGNIEVTWEKETDGRFSIIVGSPKGTRGTIAVPVEESNEVVMLNNQVIWGAATRHGAERESDGYVSFEVIGGGEHVVNVRSTMKDEV